jgi:hypothetical protein
MAKNKKNIRRAFVNKLKYKNIHSFVEREHKKKKKFIFNWTLNSIYI